MKKTIAILLVLVIGMVGVWADEAAMQITTGVTAHSAVRITLPTTTDLVSSDTYATFNALTAISGAQTVGKTTADVFTTVGKLNFFTNQTTAFTTTYTAKSMYATDIETKIIYTVKVGSGESAVSLVSTTAGTTPSNTIILKAQGTTGSLAGTLPIAVKIDDTTWDAAMTGTYTGDITFTYTAI